MPASACRQHSQQSCCRRQHSSVCEESERRFFRDMTRWQKQTVHMLVVISAVLAMSPAMASDRLGIACGDNGAFYCHDSDPKSFTRCIDHELYLFNCPDGLQFNTLSQTCDWPVNSDCGNHGWGTGAKEGRRVNHVMHDAGKQSVDKGDTASASQSEGQPWWRPGNVDPRNWEDVEPLVEVPFDGTVSISASVSGKKKASGTRNSVWRPRKSDTVEEDDKKSRETEAKSKEDSEHEDKETVAETKHEDKETVAETKHEDKETVAETKHEDKEAVAEAKHGDKETVAETKHEDKEAVAEAKHEDKETVAETKHEDKEAVAEAKHEDKETVAETKQQTEESEKESKETVEENAHVEENAESKAEHTETSHQSRDGDADTSDSHSGHRTSGEITKERQDLSNVQWHDGPCDPSECHLPNCRCPGTDIPDNMSPEFTPQMVMITFDDEVSAAYYGYFQRLFRPGRYNPNGCPVRGCLFVSGSGTDYDLVYPMYAMGMEIASHTLSHKFPHTWWATASYQEYVDEVEGMRRKLATDAGVPYEAIKGFRVPFLQVGADNMYKALYDQKFVYDTSMFTGSVWEGSDPAWPFTLDYSVPDDFCQHKPCPVKQYPGLWEIPVQRWYGVDGLSCAMPDGCSPSADADEDLEFLRSNFKRYYDSNRAPLGIFVHARWFHTEHHLDALDQFIDELVQLDDVYIVTPIQVIEWMRHPTPLGKIKSFKPWSCEGSVSESWRR